MGEGCELHVLHVISGDLWAGAEVQLFTLAKALHGRLGARVSVIILNPGRLEQELRKSGIRVIVLDETKLNGIRILLHLFRTVRELKPDILHSHRLKENILGSITAWLVGVPSMRTVHGAPEHDTGWHDFRKRVIRLLDWSCGRFLQRRIVAVSRDMAEVLAHDFPARKIRVIENGIDTDTLVRPSSRAAGQAPASSLKIGIAGRLVPVKRVDIFIHTAKFLHDAHADLHLDFCIYGDGPLREGLEALAGSLDTGSYLHFEGHADDMHAALHDVDILMMTSDHEGLPMILLEAMALGIPVIAHGVGGINEVLEGGGCGILVNEQSPESYAGAVRELVTTPDLRDRLARRALQRIESRYTATRNAEEYCVVYKEILHAAGRAASGA